MAHVLAKDLRASVLQAAIQGKLTKQLSTDSNAFENYESIKESHNRISPCKSELDYSSMDFDIPSNWVMSELNELFDFVDYRGKTPNKIKEGVFLITASNIRKGYMDYTRKEYISENEYLNRQSRGVTEYGDLLFTTEAPMGMAALCDLKKTSCGQRVITFKEYIKGRLIPKLYMLFILSPAFQHQLLDNCTGTTAKGIKADKLKHFLIPLPPIEEQARIVAKVDELMAKIDEYEKIEKELTELQKAFPGNMKDAILQAAMQGKLTEQLESDGDVYEYFNSITQKRKELIKEKQLKKESCLDSPIDETPFDIPDSWKWCYLGECIQLTSGADLTPDRYNDKGQGTVYITGASNIENGKVIVNRWTDSPRSIAKKGDLLLTCKGTVGTTCFLDLDEAHIARQIMSIRPIDVHPRYINAFISYYVNQLKAMAKSMIPGIERKNVLTALFPLPPIEEQQRIVEKLDKLLPLCDSLANLS